MDEVVSFKSTQQLELKKKMEEDADSKIVLDSEDDAELVQFVRHWDKDFDRLNKKPEENSDFDSDNDINPLDSITAAGEYYSSRKTP